MRAATLAGARALRDGLRDMLASMAARRPVAPRWARLINEHLATRTGAEQLMADGKGWRLAFVGVVSDAASLLAPVARSAALLIADGSHDRISRCGNPACVLFFVDDSKAGRRRWCSMAACGNRAKVAAFARRRR